MWPGRNTRMDTAASGWGLVSGRVTSGMCWRTECLTLCWLVVLITAIWRAGVATAFASPIGGLLFTIEEGASFYSTSIFWRGFLSTGIGVLTLHFLVECSVRHPGFRSL